ncbi:unnamed protein product [Linum tenue]|uniref:Uncharacterized protein n=1 Tax=Linum tenue TaxID=586396 RepID=A0AAV0KLS0_9ROSI|nr:unnamed protein product [Linum tenue]
MRDSSPCGSQLVAADSNVILQDREMLDGVTPAQNEQHDDPEDETGLSAGAVAKAEGRVYKLLDELTELLSQENEGLDRDKLVSLLSERLQIKPLNISSAGNLDKPSREIAVSLTDRMDGHEMTGHPTIRSSAPEEHLVDSCDKHNENNAQEPPAVIMKEEPSSSKVKRRQRRGCKIYRPKSKAKAKTPLLKELESRAYSQGQSKSFAGAVGSSRPTEAGLMCSTRIRSRRLEFKE